MRGFVLSFNPANPAAGFSYVTDFPLDYDHYGWQLNTFKFQPWFSNTTNPSYISQAMITDMEFDVDGSLILSVGDRGGFQSGYQNYNADPTATDKTLHEGNTYGDLLRFCKTGSTFTQSGVVACPNPSVNPFTYQEFYWGDHGPVSGSTGAFNETNTGGITFSAGTGSVLMNAQDPYSWFSGGTVAFSNTSGGDLWRYSVYDSGTPGASGKATGLGDLETLCDPAPIEIGNRVWSDTDRDGIQDAGEAGLVGVQIQLFQGATLISTVTTDANGQYLFTNLLPNTVYQIRVNLGQAPLAGKPLSTTDASSNGFDLIDNDMAKVSGIGVINLTTGYYGENNHTYDIGFEPNCSETVTAVGSSNCVGATATLTATASSAGTFSWTGPSSFTSALQNPTISNVQLVNAGAYTVVFTKSNGCTATSSAQVNVNPVVSITTQPTPITECIGGTQTLAVVAAGGYSPLTYQWFSSTDGGTTWSLPIAGATTATYTPLSTATGTTLFRVTVSSTGGIGCGPATSNNTSVTIVNDPVVSVASPPAIVCIGANVTLTATPTVGAGSCTVRWQSSPDGTTWTTIIGATGNTHNAVLSATTRYRAQLISCTGNGCCN
jgi:hypothetical protein